MKHRNYLHHPDIERILNIGEAEHPAIPHFTFIVIWQGLANSVANISYLAHNFHLLMTKLVWSGVHIYKRLVLNKR